MKAWQRHGRTVAALLAGLVFQSSVSEIGAQQQTLQRGQTPGPRFMVPVLRSNERNLGAQVADALRERMSGDFMMRTLWVIPKTDIDNALEQSGYSKTEPLNANDAKQLANLIRAEEYVEGTVAKTAGGYEFDGYLLLVRGDGMVQPLPKVSGAKPGDIAKGISGAVDAARKPLEEIKRCTLAARQNKYGEAIAEAQKGLKDYPNSVMARVCILEIANSQKWGADSIIKYAEDVLTLHKENRRALALVSDAYGEKKLDEKQIRALTTLLSLDPTNARLTETVVNIIAASGKPEVARPIIDEAVKQNPGDPSLIRLQWRIYLALKEYKQAAAIGEEMVKADTAAADTVFYTRIASAYLLSGDTAKAAEAAGRGTARFPQNTGLWMLQGQLARQAGQASQALVAFRKAVAIEPKTLGANLMIAQAFGDMGQPDSMLAALQAAEAAGDSKETIGGMALTQGNKLYREWNAQTPKNVDNAPRILAMLAYADKVNPSPTAKFLSGVINLVIGQTLLQSNAQTKSCDVANKASDALTNANMLIPQGAKAYPDQAGQLMQALQQFTPFADSQKKTLCK
ncbi:MAG: tetratricopeptide repeat protein [Gemmatimonadaceae bacterium]|nr:tetratricopeptide repeat protein [Gemmatimonadaceae bacterium]